MKQERHKIKSFDFSLTTFEPTGFTGWSYNFPCDTSFACPLGVFLRIGSLVFNDFCMKLGNSRCSKMTEPNFCRKFIVAQIWAKRAQRKDILHFLKVLSIAFSKNSAK